MIQYLIFVIHFLKILFRANNFFYIHPLVPVDIIRISFILFQQKVSEPTKTSEKDHLFYNTVCSKNFTHFTNLNSLHIENNMLPKNCQKPFSLYNFFSKHVSVSCQKKHLHCTICCWPRAAFLKYSESKCLYISLYLPKKIFTPKAQ